MKKIIYLFGFLTCLTASSFAQNNFPMSNAIWNVKYHDGEYLYGLIGETTFNDKIYSNLYLISDTILSEENIVSYIGSFRNEGQKVFFRPAYWMYPDILLYDFSVNLGDTVWHNAAVYYSHNGEYDVMSASTYTIIQSIDIVNGIKVINNNFVPHWVENIGNYHGFFGHIIAIPLNGNIPHLNCFKHNGIVIYPNRIHPDNPCNTCPCDGSVGIENCDIKNNSYLFQNQPNPFSETTEIR